MIKYTEQLFDLKNDPWEMDNLISNNNYGQILSEHRKFLVYEQKRIKNKTNNHMRNEK